MLGHKCTLSHPPAWSASMKWHNSDILARPRPLPWLPRCHGWPAEPNLHQTKDEGHRHGLGPAHGFRCPRSSLPPRPMQQHSRTIYVDPPSTQPSTIALSPALSWQGDPVHCWSSLLTSSFRRHQGVRPFHFLQVTLLPGDLLLWCLILSAFSKVQFHYMTISFLQSLRSPVLELGCALLGHNTKGTFQGGGRTCWLL